VLRDAGDEYMLSGALAWVARALLILEPARAPAVAEEALRLVRRTGDPWALTWELTVVAAAVEVTGDTAAVRSALDEAIMTLDGLAARNAGNGRRLWWKVMRFD